jgi:hypothetical protein
VSARPSAGISVRTAWSRGRGRPPSKKRTRPPVTDVQAEAGSRARAKAPKALLGVVCRRALKLILARAAGSGPALLGDGPRPGARGRAALATRCAPARRALQRPTAAGVGQRSAPPRTPVHWEPQCGVPELRLRVGCGEPAHWSTQRTIISAQARPFPSWSMCFSHATRLPELPRFRGPDREACWGTRYGCPLRSQPGAPP